MMLGAIRLTAGIAFYWTLASIRGIAANPDVLLLDEPSMGLAPAITNEIFERLIEIHKTSTLSIILVEQRVVEALHFASRA